MAPRGRLQKGSLVAIENTPLVSPSDEVGVVCLMVLSSSFWLLRTSSYSFELFSAPLPAYPLVALSTEAASEKGSRRGQAWSLRSSLGTSSSGQIASCSLCTQLSSV